MVNLKGILVKNLIITTALAFLVGNVHAKQYEIEATMIVPEMQTHEYQVEKDTFVRAFSCPNGGSAKIYNKKDIYTGPASSGWDAKTLIRYSIVGDIVAKLIESDSVFIGGKTSWPVVAGVEVAKEGIIQYSERNNIDPVKKEKALNVTAGISTGSSIANLIIAAGATNPLGIVAGIVGGVIVYNKTNQAYELQRLNEGKVRVLAFIEHPTDIDKAYACE